MSIAITTRRGACHADEERQNLGQNLVLEFGADFGKLLNAFYETATFQTFSGLGWGGGYQKPNLVPELGPELCQNLVPEFGARICGFKFQNLKFRIPEFEGSNSRI